MPPSMVAVDPIPSAPAIASSDEAIATLLRLVRRQLGLSTALVVEARDGAWRATHVDDDAFGLAPGAELPLRDTY